MDAAVSPSSTGREDGTGSEGCGVVNVDLLDQVYENGEECDE